MNKRKQKMKELKKMQFALSPNYEHLANKAIVGEIKHKTPVKFNSTYNFLKKANISSDRVSNSISRFYWVYDNVFYAEVRFWSNIRQKVIIDYILKAI